MSEHIPFDIQSQIMNMLPVKSLLRFRSICKSWKSLIESSDFIAHYSSQQHHLLVSYHGYAPKYVSIAHDHTFPKQKVSLTVPFKNSRIISCSHGLVCIYCDITRKAVVWNISIRKSVAVVVLAVGNKMFETTLGFGVCRETSDPKIVKIRYISLLSSVDEVTCIPSQVEVFTLSTGAWRSPYGSNLPRKSIYFDLYDDEVGIDGFFYWFAIDRNTMGGGSKLIVSFDITTEEFREIALPGDLSHPNSLISMSYLGNSLVVGVDVNQVINRDLCVWIMGSGVSHSFTKLFTIRPNGDARLRGFRKSGEPIIDIRGKRGQLAVYEPNSKCIHHLGIYGIQYSFRVYPYTETLFLLDQPDNNMVYNGRHRD